MSSRCTDMTTETRWAVSWCDVRGGTVDDCLEDDKDDNILLVMVGATRATIVLNFDECPLAMRAKMVSNKTSKPWWIDIST